MLYEITTPHFKARLLFWHGLASYGDDAIEFMSEWHFWRVLEYCRTMGWHMEQLTGTKAPLPPVSEYIGAPINHMPHIVAQQEEKVMEDVIFKRKSFMGDLMSSKGRSKTPAEIVKPVRQTPVALAEAVLRAKADAAASVLKNNELVAAAEKAYNDELALRKAEADDAAIKLKPVA